MCEYIHLGMGPEKLLSYTSFSHFYVLLQKQELLKLETTKPD